RRPSGSDRRCGHTRTTPRAGRQELDAGHVFGCSSHDLSVVVKSVNSARTRASMSSRTKRIRSMPSMPRSEGSSVAQVSMVPTMGSAGSTRASLPRTTTRSTRRSKAGSMGRGVSADMSAPTSAMTSAASWLRVSPGWVPAEWTSTLVPAWAAWWRIKAAAVCALPPFLTQANNTLGTVCPVVMNLGSCLCWGRGGAEGGHGRLARAGLGAQPEGDIDAAYQHGHCNEWSDDAGQGLAGGDAEGADGHGDGQFEVVPRGSKGHRSGFGVIQPDHFRRVEADQKHQHKIQQ